MNPQSDSSVLCSSEPLDQSGLVPHFTAQVQIAEPEVELWEPPFERWLRLADDLLRDWPHGPLPSHRA